MAKTGRRVAAGIVCLATTFPAFASGVSAGDFSATFNGVATLGLLVSALAIFLGYRLMIHAAKGSAARRSPAPRSNLKVGMKSFNIAVSNAAPGVIFAVLGCIGMVVSLWQLGK